MPKTISKFNSVNEIWYCTLRLTLNLLSHISMSLVVLTCICYSSRSPNLSVLELHVVLCVLGYQLFMCQGIVVLTKFNSWSLYLKRRHKRGLHWFLEIIGTILVVVGSAVIIKDKRVNFNTTHGILGLFALITTFLSVFNGILSSLVSKLTCPTNLFVSLKCVHGVTGITTLLLSASSLQQGFDKQSFKNWIDNGNFIIVLKFFTWLFTIFVGIEFLVTVGQRISYNINLRNAQRS